MVLVIDSEGHPDEWYERVSIMGGRLDGVVHATHTGGVLSLDLFAGYAAGLLGLVIVDSAGYFTDQEGDRWGPGVATSMQAVLASTGVPSLVLTHQSKAGQGEEAYGSIYWHNVPRARYGLTRQKDGTRVLTCHKATGLLGIMEGQEWTVEGYEEEGVPCVTGLTPHDTLMMEGPREVGTRMLEDGWLSLQDLALRAGGSHASWTRWVKDIPGLRMRAVPTSVAGRPRHEYTLSDAA
jgi:hypothetical protein